MLSASSIWSETLCVGRQRRPIRPTVSLSGLAKFQVQLLHAYSPSLGLHPIPIE